MLQPVSQFRKMLVREFIGHPALRGRRAGQFLDRQSRQHRAWMRRQNVFRRRELIALLDQQPVLFVAGAGIAPPARAHQRKRAVELEAVQFDVDFSVPDRAARVAHRIEDVIHAAIPHDDRARAVIARWNHPLEVAVLQRMVFDGDRKTLVGWIQRRALGNRPRPQDAFHLESQIVVEAPRRVFLNYENAASRGNRACKLASERFRSAPRASFASVLAQQHRS